MQKGARGLFDGPEKRGIEIGKTDDCFELKLANKVLEAPVYLICVRTCKQKVRTRSCRNEGDYITSS